MKKFLLLYMSMVSAQEQMSNADPEMAKKGMEMWMKWFKDSGDAIVDMGQPTQKVAAVGKSEAGIKGHIGGYTIVQAKDVDEVKAMLEKHPHLMMPGGASIEIIELLPAPGM